MSNELTKQEETKEVDIFNDLGFDGFVGMDDPNCLVTPRINLAQNSSKALIQGDEKFIDGLRAGEFYNDAAEKSYGNTFDAVILMAFPNVTRWGDGIGNFESAMTTAEFKKIVDAGGLHNVNGKWYYTPSPSQNEGHFKYNINFIMCLPDHLEDGLMLYSASGTSFTPAKKLAAKMKAGGGRTFSHVWELSSVHKSNDSGSFYKLKSGGDKGLVTERPQLVQFIKNNVDTAKLWLAQQTNINYGGDESTPVVTDDSVTTDEF